MDLHFIIQTEIDTQARETNKVVAPPGELLIAKQPTKRPTPCESKLDIGNVLSASIGSVKNIRYVQSE